MNSPLWPMTVLALLLISFIVVGLRQKSRHTSDYGFGGRHTGRIGGGAAIASNWTSAASLLGLAGYMYLEGYQALALVIGWTGGYVLLLVLLAGQIRRFGKFTAPDFVGERYGSQTARVLAALISIAISVIYCAAQFKGIGLVCAFLFGIDYTRAVLFGGLAVMSYIVLSGVLGVVRNQQLLYFVIIVSFILPLMSLAHRLGYFWLLPQFGYGAALEELSRSFHTDLATPFATDTPFSWAALCFTLMVGTAGLPHVLSRFYTVPNIREARWSVVWGLFFIALIYWSAPAYAVFGRLLEARAGIAPETLHRGAADLIVLRCAALGGLPGWLVGILAAGALSATFFTVAGLLLTGAASVSYDLYYCVLKRHASERARMKVAKGAALVLAGGAVLCALNTTALIAEIAALAFALAGNTIFPLFLLGIWWGRANRQGAISGMVAGVLCTCAHPLLCGISPRVASLFPLTSSALCGVPLVLTVMVLVSLASEPPPGEMRRFLANEVHGHLD